MIAMQSSDDAIDSLMGELWAQQGYSKPTYNPTEALPNMRTKAKPYKRQLCELSGYPSNNLMAGNHSIWNPYVSSPSNQQSVAEWSHLRCELPTNPQVETVRRRAFEKFKQDCSEVIQRVLGSWDLKLPIPAMLEKWQMDSKLAEAMQHKNHGAKITQPAKLFSLISATEEIYRLITSDAQREYKKDPILLGRQSADLFQAILRPEVEKAWTSKVAAQEETNTGKLGNTFPHKVGKKFQQIERALYRCICDAEEMFQHQLRQSVQLEQKTRLQNGKGGRKLPKISQDNETEQYHVTYAGISLRLHSAYFEKLQRLFDRAHGDIQPNVTVDDHSFDEALFALLCRYDMLQGAGLQAGVPGRVMDTLLLHFGCRMECFASPFNCRYERFTSAFDLDRNFGSLGSFFDLGDEFFFSAGGCFEANPPFCEGVMHAMNDRIHQLLSKSSKALMFVVFVPAWKDSQAYNDGLLKNRFLDKHLLVPSGKHWYTEGTQHRRKGSFRPASFDTSVLFYQNDAAKVKWPIQSTVIEDLKHAFCDDPGNMAKTSSSGPAERNEEIVAFSKPRRIAVDVDPTLKEPPAKRKGAKGQDKRSTWTKARDETSAQLHLLQSLGLTSIEPTTTSTTVLIESKRPKKRLKKTP